MDGYPRQLLQAPSAECSAAAAAAGGRAGGRGLHRRAAEFTGLSAGLELAERGHAVVVLEARKVGWGASGGTAGRSTDGLNAGLETIGRRYGPETAGFVATVVQEGGRIIRERVAR